LNILLITYSFPPAGGVGVLRALSLAKYLPDSGLRVDVLTARNAPAVGKDFALLDQVPPSVTVHRSWTLDLPFALRKAIKKAMSGSGGKMDSHSGATKRHKPSLLKRLIANLLLPDPQVGWLPFAIPAATRVIRKRHIDLVLITVPPFSSVRLVKRLRRTFPALPIVLDFRDEWLTTTIHLVSLNDNERARAIAHKAEAEAVREATAVVAASVGGCLEIRGRYPSEPESKFHCIPNGFDTLPVIPVLVPGSTEQPRTLVTYIGSVYGSTDPQSFVQAVQELPEETRRLLQIRFIGRIETSAYYRALKSLGDTVELTGFLPRAEALRAIEDATYLLLITHDRINIAGKMYDYLGSGKPILAAIHPDGDVRRLFEETRAGWWADVHDVGAIKRMLIQAVEHRSALGQSFHPDVVRIAAYHRRPLASRYADLLQATAGALRIC
jgi:glycosyltransferase involved in cell wall biosynthesis